MKSRRIKVSLVLCALGLFLPIAPAHAQHAPAPSPTLEKVTFDSTEEGVLLELTNKARIEHCVPVVFRNSGVDQVARDWSKEMARTGYFQHNPDFFQQIPQSNLRRGGENIVVGPRSGQAMFTTWKNSPGHWENILNPSFTDIGIGYATGPYVDVWNDGGPLGWQGRTWGTQNFGTYTDHQGGTFLDVRKGHTFDREINWLAESAITTGYSVKKCNKRVFKPSSKVTREAMAAFLYRHAGGPAVSGDHGFNDVAPTSKLADAITWAAAEGITDGYGDGGFHPKSKITREAMAAFLFRYADADPRGASGSFPDAAGSSFEGEINWLAAEGITTGYGNGTFRPKNQITREATAAWLHRLAH